MAPQSFSTLEELVPRVLEEHAAPGAAVAVYDRQGELFCRGFGWRDAARTLAVNGDTRFAFASITKTMTALLTGELVQRGLLDWDLRVCYYSFDALARPYGADAFALFDADDLLEMDIEFPSEPPIRRAALPFCPGLPPIIFERKC